MSERPPRVLAVTNMYPHSGSPSFGTFVATQMASVARAGASVQIEFINGRRNRLAYARGAWRVRRRAHAQDFDIVHAHYGLTGFVCLCQPLPLVVSFCGDDLLGTPDGQGGLTASSRLVVRLSHVAAARAAAIICKSEEMRARLPAAPDRERAWVIPNGVDTTVFCPGPRHEARDRLRIARDALLVLFPNAPTEIRKRLDLAERAVDLVRAAGLPATLWVVQGVAPERMPDYYRAADCVLLTSDWEGSPNVVKEALCCDVPMVSVDAGDAAEWIRATPGARLVGRDPAVIADGLAAVLRGPRTADGRAVRQALSSEAIAARVLTVYDAARARTRPRG